MRSEPRHAVASRGGIEGGDWMLAGGRFTERAVDRRFGAAKAHRLSAG